MTIYHFGGESDAFDLPAGHTYSISTDTTKFDSVLSRVAMVVSTGLSELEAVMSATSSDFYLHMTLAQGTVALGNYIDFKDSAGTQTQYRIEMQADGRWKFYKYDGTNFVLIGTTTNPIVVSSLAKIDIHIVRDATVGAVTILKDGGTELSVSNTDTSTPSPVGKVRFIGLAGAGNEMYISQVIIANVDLKAYVLWTKPPTGDGTHTSWVGDYTTVDENVLNSADFAETNSTGQLQTYTGANVPSAYSTYLVKGFGVSAHMSNDSGSAVNDNQFVLRINNTDYTTTNLGIVKDGTIQQKQYIWETNPNTGTAFTTTDIGSTIEFGHKSV